MDDGWPDFPVIGGTGSMHDLSDRDEPTPRLWGMKSVSKAAATALHKAPHDRPRMIGFAGRRPR